MGGWESQLGKCRVVRGGPDESRREEIPLEMGGFGEGRRRMRSVVVEGNVTVKWIGPAAYVLRDPFPQDMA